MTTLRKLALGLGFLCACKHSTANSDLVTLTIVSGDGQSAEAGAAVTNVIIVRAENGAHKPVASLTINPAVSAGGNPNPAAGHTDANGQASFTWTLGATQGTQSFVAQAPGATSATATATATRPAVADIHLDFTSVHLDLAATTPGTAVPVDARGNPVSGATVTWTPPPGGTVSLSATTGSSITITGNTIGGENLTATSEGVSRQAGFTVVRGKFVQLSAAPTHTCGRTAPGVVFCWGRNAHGELGDGSTTDRNVPTRIAGTLLFSEISAGGQTTVAGNDFTCARTADGVVYCWGDNARSQLGDGTTTGRLTPTLVSTALRFVSVSAGGSHACARTSDGTAYCWGTNSAGALGDGTTTTRTSPVPVTGDLKFAELSAGINFSCGRTAAGAGYCWGNNQSGQLGQGAVTPGPVTAPALLAGRTFSQISAGDGHGCGRTTDGGTWCWGFNGNGEIGDGTQTNRPGPTGVLTALTFTQVALSQVHNCAIATGGSAYCWGNNQANRLGDGTDDPFKLTPSPVVGGLTFSVLTASTISVCGLTITDGLTYCWGGNFYGQLGDGTNTTRGVPTLVP